MLIDKPKSGTHSTDFVYTPMEKPTPPPIIFIEMTSILWTKFLIKAIFNHTFSNMIKNIAFSISHATFLTSTNGLVIQTLIWTLLHTFEPNQILQDFQITYILKFRSNKYMGNAHKQLFFGPVSYLHIYLLHLSFL